MDEVVLFQNVTIYACGITRLINAQYLSLIIQQMGVRGCTQDHSHVFRNYVQCTVNFQHQIPRLLDRDYFTLDHAIPALTPRGDIVIESSNMASAQWLR